jgi:hypothetical protein
MATGRKTVVVGQVIDPVVWGNPLWDQSVQQFASDADRTAQFPVGQRKAGAVTWLDDVKRLDVWDGAAWRPVSPPSPAYLQAADFGNNQGAAGANVRSAGANVTLTEGLWLVQGGIAIAAGVAGVKAAWVPSVFLFGTENEMVPSARGPGENGAALGELTSVCTRAVVVSVPPAGMRLQVGALATNAGLVLVMAAAGGGTPSAWITATRLAGV